MTDTINGRTPEEIKKGLECCKPVWVDNHWKTCDTKCPYIEDVGGFCREQLMVEALTLIQQLESAQPKWISVEERLPEDDLPENSDVKVLKVFVAIKGKNGTTVRTQTRHRRTLFDTRGEPFFDWEWRYSSGKVTHWRPLPEPPKEEI